MNATLVIMARGGGGGGRASSAGARSSASRSSTSSSRSSTSKSSTTKSTPKASAAKPGSTIKTSSGATIKTSATKPSNSKYSSAKGIVGDGGYAPRFQGGYSAPPGSVVYYPQHSAMDYLPWIYLFSHNSPSNDNATIVQPDNKQVVAPPEPGTDGMAVFSWVIMVLLIAAVIAGIVWGVNKITTKENVHATI